jgi:hypothetical protein
MSRPCQQPEALTHSWFSVQCSVANVSQNLMHKCSVSCASLMCFSSCRPCGTPAHAPLTASSSFTHSTSACTPHSIVQLYTLHQLMHPSQHRPALHTPPAHAPLTASSSFTHSTSACTPEGLDSCLSTIQKACRDSLANHLLPTHYQCCASVLVSLASC